MSLPAFRRCLDGVRFADVFEHDLMALALNEHLLDHGHRFPIPYVCRRLVSETGPIARPPLDAVADRRVFGVRYGLEEEEGPRSARRDSSR